MKLLKSLCFAILASGLVMGQSNSSTTTSSASDTSNIADELKQLRESVAQQQKQIAQQQEQIQKLEQQLGTKQDVAATTPATTTTTGSVSPRVIDTSLRTPSYSSSASAQPVSSQTQPQQPESQGAKSPLSFRIGGAEFTPGGFVDFENVFRSTNTTNVAATNFWTIPYSNTVQGHLTEYRATGQYSRFNLKTTAKYGKNDITGYLEFDFNGNDAVNVFVTSNPHTDRLRLYWLDLRRGKWEFLGGQSWGMLTPNRVGVSPFPSDLATTYNEDAQIQVGINYTRAAQFRAAYHFNDNFVWAFGIENPQQYVGQAETIFPAAFNAQLGNQFDNNANLAGVPNVAPDIISKMAFDDKFAGGRQFHFELGGLFTTAKSAILPTFTGATFHQQTAYGGGIQAALNFEIFHGKEGRNLRFVANGLWGPGVGRYLIGMAPQAVVKPEVSTVGPGFDAAPIMVHSGNALVGLEFLPHPKSQFGVYAGGMYAQRLAFPDITATTGLPAVAISCQPGDPALKLPCIGFGGTNSANSANRAVQELTLDWTQTFWKNPQYGAVLMVTQASYVSRSPWFVAAGAPKDAHLGMGYVSLRYVLP